MISFQKLAAECQSAGHSGVLVPFRCDLSNVEEIQSMFSAIKAEHGGVDVCINNAGLAHPEPLLSGNSSGWKNMLDVRAQSCWRKSVSSDGDPTLAVKGKKSGYFIYFLCFFS